MANTTFSGPIRAGNILDTTGTTVGTNVSNIGSVVMSQSKTIDIIGAGTANDQVGSNTKKFTNRRCNFKRNYSK
jgi:hypothetical protein